MTNCTPNQIDRDAVAMIRSKMSRLVMMEHYDETMRDTGLRRMKTKLEIRTPCYTGLPKSVADKKTLPSGMRYTRREIFRLTNKVVDNQVVTECYLQKSKNKGTTIFTHFLKLIIFQGETKQSFGDNDSLDDLAYAFMTRDGTPVKKPTLKMDLDLHDPARNSKLNNKWAKMFFPAEIQRKKKYKKWEKEVGMDLTGEYNPVSKHGGRRSDMYNNPFPWLRKANQLGNKAKHQMNTITGKLKDKVDVKYDRKAYKILLNTPILSVHGFLIKDYKLEIETEKLET